MNKFGSYVRDCREALNNKRKGYSVRKVAEKIGVEPAFLSKVERDLVPPPSEKKIIALAKVIEVDADVLLAMAGKVSSDLLKIIQKRPLIFADLIRKSPHEVVLAANKYEGDKAEVGFLEAYELGFGEPIGLSAEHGHGIGELYDRVKAAMGSEADLFEEEEDDEAFDPDTPFEVDPDVPLRVAILGRPNAGKSTLINHMLGEERMLTGPEAGITRDAIGIDWQWQEGDQKRPIKLWDTAGIRRKSRVSEKLEKLSVADALRAVKFAEIVVLLIDADTPFDKQDVQLADLVEREGRAMVIAINKWDLKLDRNKVREIIRDKLEFALPRLRGIPVITMSAKTGKGVERLMPAVIRQHEIWNGRVPTARLNKWLADATARHAPPADKGRPVRLRYVTQAKARPPTFAAFSSRGHAVPESYIRYFQGKGRKGFNIWLRRYVQYKDLMLPILEQYDLPEELIVVSMIESGFDPKAISRAKAVGLWQFMYSTGKQYGLNRNWYIDERQDPIKSTHAAAKYFKDLYNEFEDWYLVLAAYNTGPGRVNRALKLHDTSDYWQLYSLPKDTKNYIPYYLSSAIILQNPEKYGFKIPKSNPLRFDEVEIEKSSDLNVLAKAADTKVSTIKKLNPELRQPATPNNGPYSLNIPFGKKESFYKKFNSIPDDEKFAVQKVEHRVQKGENLTSIAAKYRVLKADLQTINNITNANNIRIGQILKIPVKGGIYANYPEKIIYKVKVGDQLGFIAEKYNTRASEIRKWNGMEANDSTIYPGQKLTLFVKGQPVKDTPKKNVYIVKSGDNLSMIAEKNNTTVSKIKSWNSMKSSTIYPGQKLTIYFE